MSEDITVRIRECLHLQNNIEGSITLSAIEENEYGFLYKNEEEAICDLTSAPCCRVNYRSINLTSGLIVKGCKITHPGRCPSYESVVRTYKAKKVKKILSILFEAEKISLSNSK